MPICSAKIIGDYNYIETTTEVQSNHLYQVDFTIENAGNRDVISKMSTLVYAPKSDPGSLDGGNFVK